MKKIARGKTPKESNRELIERDLSTHVFSVSATLTGICLTVIGIMRLSGYSSDSSKIGDDLIVINTIGYLSSCFLSYFSIRSTNMEKRRKLENIADKFFITSLSLTTFVCGILVWTTL